MQAFGCQWPFTHIEYIKTYAIESFVIFSAYTKHLAKNFKQESFNSKGKMARRGAPNEDLSNIEFETSEDVEVVPTFNSMVSEMKISTVAHRYQCIPFIRFPINFLYRSIAGLT